MSSRRADVTPRAGAAVTWDGALVEPFASRRRRALDLAGRHAYAAHPLRLAAAIAEPQGRAFERARLDRPAADELPAYAVRVALPGIMDAAMSAGTELVREAVLLRFHEGDLERIVGSWLGGEEQSPTDVFLARSAAAPLLEALPDARRAYRLGSDDARRCPECGGVPQLAVFADSGEALVTGRRLLVCSRCASEWTYPRLVCVSCGETGGANLPILADEARLPHLRVDACDVCRAYLVTVDARRDPAAVALVDEIAALPLDLLAAERGYRKITPNVMGF